MGEAKAENFSDRERLELAEARALLDSRPRGQGRVTISTRLACKLLMGGPADDVSAAIAYPYGTPTFCTADEKSGLLSLGSGKNAWNFQCAAGHLILQLRKHTDRASRYSPGLEDELNRLNEFGIYSRE